MNPYGPPPVAGYNTTPLHSFVATPNVGVTTTPEAPVVAVPEVAVTTTTGAALGGPVVAEAERTYVPNPYLLGFGLTLWGASYAPSVAVAAASGNSADRSLYVPVVGPWIDLASRSPCTGNGCSSESTNRALLVTDGTLQGLGTVLTLVSFFSPTHREILTIGDRNGPRLHIEPAWVGSSYGVRALAQF